MRRVEMATDSATLRQSGKPLGLVCAAIGGPREIRAKLARLSRTLKLVGDAAEIERRLETLSRRGYIARRPSRLQLAFGSLDMVRFVIVPFARDYYAQRGIDFHFHQILRFLDDPVSVVDPTGLLSDRDTIIGHLMQVVHLNPVYDLQLLEMFDDGIEELERQVAEMVAGSHPRARTIGAVVEDAHYHARLLDYVRAWRGNQAPPELVRDSTLRSDPHAAAAERTFASLPGFIDYCCRLPRRAPALAARYRRTRRFPIDMAPPAPAPRAAQSA